jgi:hypothetical protein
MTQQQYENHELALFRAQLESVERLPRDEARENADEFAFEPHTIIAERASWLIAGNYGYGSYRMAQMVLERKRMNREAWLYITIAALEWGVPSRLARKVWRESPQAYKDELNALLGEAIADYEEAAE